MIALASALFLLGTPTTLDDWPCWRGPERDGVSRERGWLSEGRETPLWSREVGAGHSSSVVVGERLLTLGFDGEAEVDRLWCLEAGTGAVLWTAEYGASLDAQGHGGGTHSTPCVAGNRVFVFSREGVLRSFSLEDGAELWTCDLVADHDVRPTGYGFGGSPVVVGPHVFVNAARTFCLEAASGELVWGSDDRSAMYSTPTPWLRGDEPVLAVFAKQGLSLFAFDDGRELAHVPWKKGDTAVNASSPVVVDGTRLFFSSAYDHGCAMVDFPVPGEAPRTLWESKVMRTKLSGCVLLEGRLFGFDESMLKAVSLEGKELWRKRGLGMGSLTASDGRLLVQSEKGELVVVDATAARYTELARRELFQRGPAFWSSPVLSHGRVYCRSGSGELVCLDHRSR